MARTTYTVTNPRDGRVTTLPLTAKRARELERLGFAITTRRAAPSKAA